MKDVVELVEVQELPAPVSGNAIYDTEHPYRHAEHVRQVWRVLAECSQTEWVQLDISVEESVVDGRWQRQMRVIQGLFRLLDATPKNEQGAVIARVLAGIHGDNELARLQAALDSIERARQAVPKAEKIPLTASPFDSDGAAIIGNNPPVHVLFESLTKGGETARNKKNGWKGRDNNPQLPVFRTPQRVKGDWTVYFDANSCPEAEQWGRVEGLSALHTKLGLFCLAKICDPRNNMRHPNKEPTGVSYEDLRRALGLRGKPMAEFKPLADSLVKDLTDLKATVRGIMINGKPDGIADCSLFVVSKVWDKQYEFFDERAIIGWLIDPGPWAKHYFNRNAKPWLSTLQSAVLALDHRGVRRADVLALHITTLLFVVAGGDQFKEQAITRTVADLLELAGELPEPEHRTKDWGGRTAEALHTALETMQGRGLVAAVEYGPTYPDPGDRGKGWVARWLSATITLTSPEAAAFLEQDTPAPTANIPARLERKRKAHKRKLLGDMLDVETAARLRERIAQQFVSQRDAAQRLGCSQSMLSLVLNRRRAPGELAPKLQELLDSPT